ncbi:MAG: 1-acyl-sn-glycerol-3-phosphate acyltransferase [Planctomycetota bacterium]|jgi:1-acyl-sn-glycerol-3-phosphate acyltransferase|nr:1-acyl-sn-glycerol-3-phosphate acyltransferase [Planctomycetota bacterium]
MAWKSFYLSAGMLSALARPFLKAVTGAAFLPNGPVLVAAPHTSFLDGPLLALAYAREKLLPLHMIAYREPFSHWLLGWILRSGGAIPFRRGDKDSQFGMLTAALGWLAAGEAVGIFPEGHLNPADRLNRPRPGLALLALESGLPIVPAVVSGSELVLPPGARMPRLGRTARVVFGQPIRLFPKERRYASLPREERAEMIRNIGFRTMAALAELSGKPPPED